MPKWVVFASGRGTNFRALVQQLGPLGLGPSALVTDVAGCGATEIARAYSIPVFSVSYDGRSKKQVEQDIIAYLDQIGSPTLLVLAGYMRILSSVFLSTFPGKIINIHPSLLPRHPGKNGLRDSLGSGDEYLGVTIHYVDEGVDTGKIIVQESFRRSSHENDEELEVRIHSIEHRIYPQVVQNLLAL